MTSAERLRLYEKAMLLILKDREGTIAVNAANHVLAGALLSELLLEERIVAEGDEHLLVPRDPRPVGEPLLDECLELIRTQAEPLPAKRWVPKLGALPGLHHRVARGLCQRGILREDEGKVLLFFTRRVYPEVDPAPEQALIEELESAIFTDTDEFSPHTAALVSLGSGSGLLHPSFGRQALAARRQRIEAIAAGDLAGAASAAAIKDLNTVVFLACT